MNRIDFSQPNGFPLEADATLGGMQENYTSAIKALAAACGDNVIVSGLVSNNGICSEGWIVFGGDLVQFNGGVISDYFHILTDVASRANENGVLVERYFTKSAVFGQHHSLPNYYFAGLQRLAPQGFAQKMLIGLGSLESGVILSGCALETDNRMIRFNVMEGLVLIDGELLKSPRADNLSGQWYLMKNAAGQAMFSPNAPSNSGYIGFEVGGTAQYYKDVLARTNAYVGEIRMMVVRSTDFTENGLGQNRMKGWAICNGANGTVDMGGRTPFGFQKDAAKYGMLNAVGGTEKMTLSVANMPPHNHQGGRTGSVMSNTVGLMRRSNVGENNTISAVDSQNSGDEPDLISSPQYIPMEGDGQPFEILPPHRVVLYIQRI